ncbi:velvet factor-domain-containing protein [Gautieria morchelliformis]|nr:velvet factor-domain-containing protein [Gautieria morchelliformis]
MVVPSSPPHVPLRTCKSTTPKFMHPYPNPLGNAPVGGPSRIASRNHNDTRIGRPVPFASGPCAGLTLRAELREEQKADLGRKFSKRDRRPVDPPPVVRVRMYQVFNAETDHPTEKAIPAEQIVVGGLICHIDLYAIRPTPYPHSRPVGNSGEGSSAASDPPPPTLVAPMPPAEESKVTSSLFGTTFAPASQIKGLDGNEVIFFVFSDLSVRTEGMFILRYRMFDIFSRMEGSEDVPVLAQCYSGPVAIYSTKEFPGLRPSTELTKHLSRYGIRVNVRESERKRKAAEPPAVEPEEPAESSSGRPPHLD